MPGLVSTRKETTLVNNEMVIVKTKLGQYYNLWNSENEANSHHSRKFQSATNALSIQEKNWAIILWLLEVQRDEEKNSLLAQSPVTDSVVQSTAWSLTPSQVICLHPSFKDN